MAHAPSAIHNQPHANRILFNWKMKERGMSRAPSVRMAEGVPRHMWGTTRLLTLAPAPREELWMKGWSNSASNGNQLNPRDK